MAVDSDRIEHMSLEDWTGSDPVQVNTRLDRAKKVAREALRHLQDIPPDSGCDLDGISSSFAGVLREIFRAQVTGAEPAESIRRIQEVVEDLRCIIGPVNGRYSNDLDVKIATTSATLLLDRLFPPDEIFEPIPLVNKKKLPREHNVWVIHVEVGPGSENNFFTGFDQDISTGGLFIATYNILEAGTKLDVNVELPDSPPLLLRGTVRWIREDIQTDISPGMGVVFENLSREETDIINSHIRKNPPIFYEHG